MHVAKGNFNTTHIYRFTSPGSAVVGAALLVPLDS